jgi:hypothetical protein
VLNHQEQPLMFQQTQMPPMTRLLLHQNIKTKQMKRLNDVL